MGELDLSRAALAMWLPGFIQDLRWAADHLDESGDGEAAEEAREDALRLDAVARLAGITPEMRHG